MSVRHAACGMTGTPHSALRRGFTFVELLIAATMISVLFVGLGTHLRGGLTVWQRATETGEALQRREAAWERLERDLANAVIYDERVEAYGLERGKLPQPQFGADSARFFTVSSPTRQMLPSVRFVTYACKATGEQGGFVRTSQSVGAARAKISPAPADHTRLLPECQLLSFQYAYRPAGTPAGPGVEWRAEWPDQAAELLKLPRLVRVSIGTGGRLRERVFAVPTGDLGTIKAVQ